jgi:hypothetical protein
MVESNTENIEHDVFDSEKSGFGNARGHDLLKFKS